MAVPGAVVQISVATVLGVLVGWMFGWSAISGLVFGMAISVASTVVLTRVLEDNQNLHTPGGHVALGWLVVEDLFTILLLVLIPAVMEARQSGAGDWGGILSELGWMFVKLALLVALTLFAGKKSFRWCCGTWPERARVTCLRWLCWSLRWAWRCTPRILWRFHGFGGVFGGDGCRPVGLLRAAAEAMLMRDAFAVLFFVSVGMMFDPMSVGDCWPLALATLGVVMIGKPLAAYVVVRCLRRPVPLALSVSVALAQVGEFSFHSRRNRSHVQHPASGCQSGHHSGGCRLHFLKSHPVSADWTCSQMAAKTRHRACGPGGREQHGLARSGCAARGIGRVWPTGRILKRILNDNGVEVIIVEMNIDTVTAIREQGGILFTGMPASGKFCAMRALNMRKA